MILIINLKTYNFGNEKICKKISEFNKESIICVQATELGLSGKVKNDIYSQHVDYFEKGRNTGYILPEAVKVNGGEGTLVNHSEHRLKFSEIKKTIERCRKLKLKTIVCVKDLREAKKVMKLNPDMMAYEDPKLVASGKSIVHYKSRNVKKFVMLLIKTKIKKICGAGISSVWDVMEAKRLGCDGVLVASVVAKNKNPEVFLREVKEHL